MKTFFKIAFTGEKRSCRPDRIRDAADGADVLGSDFTTRAGTCFRLSCESLEEDLRDMGFDNVEVPEEKISSLVQGKPRFGSDLSPETMVPFMMTMEVHFKNMSGFGVDELECAIRTWGVGLGDEFGMQSMLGEELKSGESVMFSYGWLSQVVAGVEEEVKEEVEHPRYFRVMVETVVEVQPGELPPDEWGTGALVNELGNIEQSQFGRSITVKAVELLGDDDSGAAVMDRLEKLENRVSNHSGYLQSRYVDQISHSERMDEIKALMEHRVVTVHNRVSKNGAAIGELKEAIDKLAAQLGIRKAKEIVN